MDPSHLHIIREGGGGGVDRFPQWSIQETRDLLMIRAELDSKFMETKRNKFLWEVVSTKMKERGYYRSGEQCKSKWKNLVTRYKGLEMMEEEGTRQEFPFYNELQAIFTNRMQRLLWMVAEEEEGIPISSGSKKRGMKFSSEDEEDDRNEISYVDKASGSSKKKCKVAAIYRESESSSSSSSRTVSMLKETLAEFMKQQMQTEMQLMKMYEAKEEERRMKEMEWRKTMEALKKERMMLHQQWRQREDQIRMREEARAEKRDALITALLNKLTSHN